MANVLKEKLRERTRGKKSVISLSGGGIDASDDSDIDEFDTEELRRSFI